MRTCSICQEAQPDDNFRWRNKAKGTRQACCKSCQSEYDKKWYKDHPHRKDQILKANNVTRLSNRAAVDAIKLERGCMDCGYNAHPAALEFDHLHSKVRNIGLMRNGAWSLEAVMKEIAKCEVVCANCHRIRTETRRFNSVGRVPPL